MFFFFFLFTTRRPPCSPLFPYTTLFRSGPMSNALSARNSAAVPLETATASDVPVSSAKAFSKACVRDPAVIHAESSVSRSEEHTSELQSRVDLVCRLLLEKKKKKQSRSN